LELETLELLSQRLGTEPCPSGSTSRVLLDGLRSDVGLRARATVLESSLLVLHPRIGLASGSRKDVSGRG